MESVPVGLVVVDQEGEIIHCNNAASKILGYERDNIEGKGWAEVFFDNEKNTEFNDIFIDVIWKKKINLRKEVIYYSPSGKTRHLSTTSSFLFEEDEIAGIVLLLDDITDIFLIRQHEKLILEEKNRIQKERAESLKKLAFAVAHEIRNPTVFIGGFANRMLKQIGDANSFSKYLKKIVCGTKRLEDIVNAVNDYAEINTLSLTEISSLDLLEKTRKKLYSNNSILFEKINWSIETDDFKLTGDPYLLIDALYEVILNSIESIYSEAVELKIRSWHEKNINYLEISDNGSGITEQNLPFVFDPFFSTKPDKIGMGLTKAQRIIKEHGGEIKIESVKNRGTKVTLVIPDKQDIRSPESE